MFCAWPRLKPGVGRVAPNNLARRELDTLYIRPVESPPDQNTGGALPRLGESAIPPNDSKIALMSHLRFAAAVMSTDSFAMKLAPHQLDPGAGNGLIGVVAMPVAV
jgi:hypothetical protein